jgi:outer membrane cobalamin receptor
MTRHRAGRSGRQLRLPSIALSSLLFVLVLARAASADDVKGRVIDPQDRPVVSAEVIVVHARRNGIAATAHTDAQGRFGPVRVAPGEYVILVVAPGLKSTRPAVTVTADRTAEIDVKLVTSAVSESIVVSAAHIDTPLSRATDSVSVESGESLAARQVETVAEAMRLVPGIGVVNSGGRGAITSFFPRGGEADYTLVLVDGVPQNLFGGFFDAAHLATTDVDRIEVVRGPQSALYGGGAIGGIVHVLTRHGGPMRVRALAEGGSQGTWHASGSAAGSRGPWTWGGSIDRLFTDGNTSEVPGLGGRVSNDDYQRWIGAGSLGWSNRPDRRLRFDLRAGRNERGFPGAFGSDPLDRNDGVDTVSRGRNESIQAGVSAALGSASSLRQTALVTFADFKGRFISPGFTPGSNFESEDRSRRTAARYQIDIERNRAGLTGGVEVLGERADNTFVTGSTFEEIPIERFIAGMFVEARPRLGDRVFLTGGVRVERIERRALDGDGFSRPSFDPDTVWSANPKVSFAWFVRPATSGNGGFLSGSTKIRAGAGTGIKPPTTFEIGFTDNPGLKPERSRSVDVGVEQSFANSALVVDLTWFANRYDDLIVSFSAGNEPASGFRSDNIANARARGLELGVNGQLGRGLTARATWTFLDTEVLALDGEPGEAPRSFAVGDPLVRRPRHQGSLALVWSAARGSVFVTVHGRGRMADLEPNFASPVLAAPGYATVAIGGSVRLTPQLEILARVSNLFDRVYEDALGFPALGRSAMVGLRVAAGR